MKVLFDHQIFLFQNYGGVSRYHYKLLEHLRTLDGNDSYDIVINGSINHYLSDRGALRFLGTGFWAQVNKQIVCAKVKHYDVFHPTYYNTYFLEKQKVPRYVLTVHDMIPEWEYKAGNGVFKDLVLRKRKLLQHAAAVIAISEATRKDLHRFWDVDDSKVFVVHHGEPEYFSHFTATSQEQLPGKPYVLYVGERKGYKNFDLVLRGLSLFLNNTGVKLVVVGRHPSAEELQRIAQYGLMNQVVFKHGIPDRELWQLYRQAVCFVYPSLIEGFGFPLLEAFAAGCPIVCSRIDCFTEIAADAALYFDPYSPAELSAAVEKLYCNSQEKSELIKKGSEQLRNFSWHKTAAQTCDVYRTVSGK